MTTIAERLMKTRKLRGLSQAQLALLAGLTTAAVSNIETGTRQGKGSLHALSKALGVNLEWLMNGVGEVDAVPLLKTAPEYSPEALALAWLLDQIPNRLDKTIANNSATAAILEVLQRIGAAPTGTPVQRVTPAKHSA
jgi:transcriptional regulator with XRE-family HTH domain